MVPARSTRGVLVRGALLLVLGATAGRSGWRLCAEPAGALAGEVLGHGPDAVGRLPFEQVLIGTAAVVLIGCTVWLSAVAALTLLTQIAVSLGAPASALGTVTGRVCPRVVRTAVATALGVGVAVAVSTPAPADPPGGATATGLSGLRVPDRTLGAPQPISRRAEPPQGPDTRVVRAGDSLWSITAALLPDRATDRDITEGWHHVYRANRARIGPDPDLVVVGTRLVVPSFVSLHERTIREHARAPVRRSAPPATRTG